MCTLSPKALAILGRLVNAAVWLTEFVVSGGALPCALLSGHANLALPCARKLSLPAADGFRV